MSASKSAAASQSAAIQTLADVEPPSDADFDAAMNELATLADRLIALEAVLRARRWPENDGFDLTNRLLASAVRLYSSSAEFQTENIHVPELGLTPTDAVVVSAALLHDQNMTPFDLTLWINRTLSEAFKANTTRLVPIS